MLMTPLQRSEDRQMATQQWAKINHSMSLLKFGEDEIKAICSVLAAIYHLGVAGTMKGKWLNVHRCFLLVSSVFFGFTAQLPINLV